MSAELLAELGDAANEAVEATTDLDAKEQAKQAAIEAAAQAASKRTEAETKLDTAYAAVKAAIKRAVVILFLLMPATALAVSTPAPLIPKQYERRPVIGILQRADAAWVGFRTGLLGPKPQPNQPHRVANP
jgi:hypothetical protein